MARRISVVWGLGLAALLAVAENSLSENHARIEGRALGAPVQSSTGRTVRIHTSSKYINVHQFEAVIIENDKGQRFTWQFATRMAPTGFPLRNIAPAGFESGDTWIYVIE